MNASAQDDVEMFRRRWQEAQRGRLADELVAFIELARHPNCRWQDLLDALERPSIVGEDAWLQLRLKLKESVGVEGAIRRDRVFWEGALRQRGIDPLSRCSERKSQQA